MVGLSSRAKFAVTLVFSLEAGAFQVAPPNLTLVQCNKDTPHRYPQLAAAALAPSPTDSCLGIILLFPPSVQSWNFLKHMRYPSLCVWVEMGDRVSPLMLAGLWLNQQGPKSPFY